jgi:tRNA 5-methylaminomethyl-2-thiouridine biosynthesis bifunctional protein
MNKAMSQSASQSMSETLLALQPATISWTDEALRDASWLRVPCDEVLPRCAALAQSRAQSKQKGVRVVETGFAAGLNFLALAHAWLNHAPPNATLHYMAFEPHPFLPVDLAKAHSLGLAQLAKLAKLENPVNQANPISLANLADELRAQYPPLLPGWHDIWLAKNTLRLTLWFGDVQPGLVGCDGSDASKVDAWWLSSGWPALYQQMARLSHRQTEFWAFVALGTAAELCRGLVSAGFAVQKTQNNLTCQSHQSYESCFGTLQQVRPCSLKAPWFSRPTQTFTKPAHAIVVGAGLAGASVARTLANAGWQVTVLEASERVASQASGNLAGTVHPLITADWNLRSQWYLQGFAATLRALQPALQAGASCGKLRGELRGELNGLVQLLVTQTSLERVQEAFRRVGLPESMAQWQSAEQASQTLGTLAAVPGVYFPQGGWLHPESVVNYCLAHPAISVKTAHLVTDFVRQGSKNGLATGAEGIEGEEGLWQVTTPAQTFCAEVLVFATGGLSSELNARLQLPIRPVKGQVTHLSAAQQTTPLNCPVTHAGYSSPCGDGLAVTGATFEAPDMGQVLSAAGHVTNLENARQALPNWLADLSQPNLSQSNALDEACVVGGRIAFRPTTPDHLPIIGAVPDPDWLQRSYLSQSHTHAVYRYPPQRYQPGLFVSNGHGPRGLMSVFLAAETILADVQGQALLQPLALYHASHPARFVIRAWRSGLAND